MDPAQKPQSTASQLAAMSQDAASDQDPTEKLILDEKIQAWDRMLRDAQETQKTDVTDKNDANSVESFVEDMKRDLCLIIMVHIYKKQIGLGGAQKLAQDFYAMLPCATREELMQKLDALGKKFPEAQELYVKYGNKIEDEKKTVVLKDIAGHLRSGNIDEAVRIMKGEQQA